MFDTSDTIAAISSPAGPAGRAIVRATGPRALAVAQAIFTPAIGALADLGGFRSVAGQVRGPGLALPGRAYVFRAPRSYTRQDLVELHVPGEPLPAAMVLEAMLAAGARPAQPGEFTRRAFLHGRIDLSAAEAVADVIAAATDAQLRAANANAAGELGRLCRQWQVEATEALAETEASIDLAEEPLELLTPDQLAGRLADLAGRIDRALGQAVTITSAAETPRAALAGAPNVGKSSLLNALTGLDRAIVSATAGTTRDVLSAPMWLEGMGQEILLLDLAGLAAPAGAMARAADAAARAALACCDALLLVVDATRPELEPVQAVRANRPDAAAAVLVSKIDRLTVPAAARLMADLAQRTPLRLLATSTITGAGLTEVRALLGEMLGLHAQRSSPGCALHERQRAALAAAGAALARAAELAGPLAAVADRAEILAVELRTALAALGTICGDVVTEELLGRIFERFCAGK